MLFKKLWSFLLLNNWIVCQHHWLVSLFLLKKTIWHFNGVKQAKHISSAACSLSKAIMEAKSKVMAYEIFSIWNVRLNICELSKLDLSQTWDNVDLFYEEKHCDFRCKAQIKNNNEKICSYRFYAMSAHNVSLGFVVCFHWHLSQRSFWKKGNITSALLINLIMSLFRWCVGNN